MTKLISQVLDFLDQSPTPFHCVSNLKQTLKAFSPTIKNDTALCAYKKGKQSPQDSGFIILGAHSDSPCLKLKPNPLRKSKNITQALVEVYGGVLLSTWFDRELALAGRVTFQNKKGILENKLLNIQKPLAIIPNLAIHLDRSANENKTINAQKELPVLWSLSENTLDELIKSELKLSKAELILGFDLSFYPFQKASLVGANQELLASARLDNLLSCFIISQVLLEKNTAKNIVIIINDHEEVGSNSFAGAESPFLKHELEKICGSRQAYFKALEKSLFVSCDNAHAWHPNYPEKYDDNHAPLLGSGPVIKFNANQRYATNSETAAMFASACEMAKVPYQKFVVRSDMACGSTIGPITAANLGIKTVDVGIPQLAMHSSREMCAVSDVFAMFKSLVQISK